MIKWIAAAVLVAGTFGVVWTAPWKDDAQRLQRGVSERLFATYSTIGLRAENGACAALARPPDAAERAAVDLLLRQLRRDPRAELSKGELNAPTTTVHELAERQAAEIAGCFARVPGRATGWDALRRRLDAGIAAAR